MTGFTVGLLLSVLAAYLLAPFALRLLSCYTLAARTPFWLSVPAVGSAILVLAGVAFGVPRPPLTIFGVAALWLGLSLWTMPASAAVYYFGAAVRAVKGWYRGPNYVALTIRK